MKFVLACTTYNRLSFLKQMVESFVSTVNRSHEWTLLIADDGSSDGTLEYLHSLSFEFCEFIIFSNYRIGVHGQKNVLIKNLENRDFDLCFCVDDDILFRDSGWDTGYFDCVKSTGVQHLVFVDPSWHQGEQLANFREEGELISRTELMNIQGAFYTLTKEIIREIGYFDISNFGFRGMGHVDYTARCARNGFTSMDSPWDWKQSERYIQLNISDYIGALDHNEVSVYDEVNRQRKEQLVEDNSRGYVKFKDQNELNFVNYQRDVIKSYKLKMETLEEKIIEVNTWHKKELKNTIDWYENRLNQIPSWLRKILNKRSRD